jgi:hypothetical protein
MNLAPQISRLTAVLGLAAALSGEGGTRFKPGSWLGIQVGKSSLAEARQRLGTPEYSGPAYEETEAPTGREVEDSYVIDKPLAGRLQVYAMRPSLIISAMEFTPKDHGFHLSDMERLFGAKLVARQYEWCPGPGYDTGGSWYAVPNPAGSLFSYEDLAKGLRVQLSLKGTVEVVEFRGKRPITKCPKPRSPRQSQEEGKPPE